MKIRRILLDMDEVLTDFVGAACELWGASYGEVLPHWPPAQWDMVSPVDAAIRSKGIRDPESPELTFEEFWKPINENEAFWAGMRKTPWCDAVITLVRMFCDDVHVISAPSLCISSHTGKIKWLRRMFGQDFSNFALTPYKELFVSEGVVLIDDRDLNCERFRKHGGTSIVFPTHHNRMHSFKTDPVQYVESALNQLTQGE
jgi:5'(3')-deoxyribonucleotidase